MINTTVTFSFLKCPSFHDCSEALTILFVFTLKSMLFYGSCKDLLKQPTLQVTMPAQDIEIKEQVHTLGQEHHRPLELIKAKLATRLVITVLMN